ncbi:hypothetical protein KC315_g19871, partial [Hortaea werneckii]
DVIFLAGYPPPLESVVGERIWARPVALVVVVPPENVDNTAIHTVAEPSVVTWNGLEERNVVSAVETSVADGGAQETENVLPYCGYYTALLDDMSPS